VFVTLIFVVCHFLIMSQSNADDDPLESTSNYNETRSRRKYYCEKYTEKPLGLEKYQYRIIYIGIAHILGFIGSYSCYTFQYPSVLPVGEPERLQSKQINNEWFVISRNSKVKDYFVLCSHRVPFSCWFWNDTGSSSILHSQVLPS